MPLIEANLSGTVVCIGTGPSLTAEQIQVARAKGFALAGCNNVWQIVPDMVLHYACNESWWCYYWSAELAAHPAQKWTTSHFVHERYGVNRIGERNAPGLSTNPKYVHHGHGSGYSLVNLAYLSGATRIVLLGYDMKYAPDYDGGIRRVGASPRHYFGEYPSALQHWPKVSVRHGVHVQMLDLYRSIATQGLVEVINATPDSAIDCFPRASIDAL